MNAEILAPLPIFYSYHLILSIIRKVTSVVMDAIAPAAFLYIKELLSMTDRKADHHYCEKIY